MSGTWASDWALNDIVTVAEFRKGMGCVADSTLGVAAASFDFTGLPTTYAHMLIEVFGRSTTAATNVNVRLRINNDSTANYYTSYLNGQNSVASAGVETAATSCFVGDAAGSTAAAGVFGACFVNIPNYAAAQKHGLSSSVFAFADGTAANMATRQMGGYYNVSGAISRVTVFPVTGTFDVGSRCSIYVMGS